MMAKQVLTTVTVPADARLAFGYLRVSAPQIEAGDYSVEDQRREIAVYFAECLQRHGYVWTGEFVEGELRQRRTRFAQRAAAGQLNGTASRGDVIVIARFDRAFQNVEDFTSTARSWAARGVDFAILDLNWCTVGAADRAAAVNAYCERAAAKEFADRVLSLRLKEALAFCKARGNCTGWPPIGMRRYYNRVVEAPQDREVCRWIVAMREQGYTQYELFCHLRRTKRRRYNGKPWSFPMVKRTYAIEKQRQHEEANGHLK